MLYKYEWIDPVINASFTARPRTGGLVFDVLNREVLRLAKRVKDLEGDVAAREQIIKDQPRVGDLGDLITKQADRIADLEAERDAAQVTADEGQEIIAELSAALAIGHGEELEPCSPPCAGHLGPKARKAVDGAAIRWARLRDELTAARGANDDLGRKINRLIARHKEESERAARAEASLTERQSSAYFDHILKALSEQSDPCVIESSLDTIKRIIRERDRWKEMATRKITRILELEGDLARARAASTADNQRQRGLVKILEAAIEDGIAHVEEARETCMKILQRKAASPDCVPVSGVLDQLDLAHEVLSGAVAVRSEPGAPPRVQAPPLGPNPGARTERTTFGKPLIRDRVAALETKASRLVEHVAGLEAKRADTATMLVDHADRLKALEAARE